MLPGGELPFLQALSLDSPSIFSFYKGKATFKATERISMHKLANESPLTEDEAVRYMGHMAQVGIALCTEPQASTERLCQEVLLLTKGRAQLILNPDKTCRAQPCPIHYHMHYREKCYGVLQVTPASKLLDAPKLSHNLAEALAHECCFILCVLDGVHSMHSRLHRINPQAIEPLTSREQQIIVL